jgi:putative oxidoreductase
MAAFSGIAPHAHWLLRLGLAGVFLYHGIIKFPMLDMLAEMMGFPVFMVALLAVAETLGGIFILVGGFGFDWMTRAAGAIFTVVMIGAIVLVHAQHGWNSVTLNPDDPQMGMMQNVMYLMAALYFLIAGNGRPATTTPAAAG